MWLEGKNLAVRGKKTLLSKHYRPFPIKEKIGKIAYCLALLSLIKIYDIFYIDLLLPYKEIKIYRPIYIRLPSNLIEGEKEYIIEYIQDVR